MNFTFLQKANIYFNFIRSLQLDLSYYNICWCTRCQVSYVRRSVGGEPVAEWPTPDVLNCYESRPFWINWANGRIHVGSGMALESGTWLRYHDPEPYVVNGLSVCTTGGSAGEWTFGKLNSTWLIFMRTDLFAFICE